MAEAGLAVSISLFNDKIVMQLTILATHGSEDMLLKLFL